MYKCLSKIGAAVFTVCTDVAIEDNVVVWLAGYERRGGKVGAEEISGVVMSGKVIHNA